MVQELVPSRFVDQSILPLVEIHDKPTVYVSKLLYLLMEKHIICYSNNLELS
jgi:hypothetical protein